MANLIGNLITAIVMLIFFSFFLWLTYNDYRNNKDTKSGLILWSFLMLLPLIYLIFSIADLNS